MLFGAQDLGSCPLGSGCRITDFDEWLIQFAPIKDYAVTGSYTIVSGSYIIQLANPPKAYAEVNPDIELIQTGWEEIACDPDGWEEIGGCRG